MLQKLFIILLVLINFPAYADINISHAIAMHGEPKYKKDFGHKRH